MRRTIVAVLAALLAVLLLGPPASATPARALAVSCATPWGSLAETDLGSASEASLLEVRSGRHACFDRLVLDVRGAVDGYDVRYVGTIRADGSGRPVPVAGAADLRVVVRVPVVDDAGHVTFRPDDARHLCDVVGYRTFRQVAFAGSFEGQTTIALGVRARLPFRVLVLDGPGDHSRLVIDVAHRW